MAVRIGISLIAWQNDDLPELTKDFTTEGAMQDAARIGYSGVERGRRMLDESGLALITASDMDDGARKAITAAGGA